MLAMLGFASMDTITKWMVADYPIGQMMWVRYAIFCLFAWFVVRRRGLRAAARSKRPWLQIGRALLAVIESAVFVLAFRYLPLADTHAIAATSPLIVIALGVLFLGERAGLGALAGRRRGLRRRAADRAPGLPRRSTGRCCCRWPAPSCGRAYQILIRLCSRTDTPDTTLVWSAFVAFGATTLVGPLAVAMARRHGLGAADRHRRAGRAGALRADQGARLCRGRRGPALQLHAARLRHDPGRDRVRRHPRPLDPGRRRRDRGDRPLHLAPRTACCG